MHDCVLQHTMHILYIYIYISLGLPCITQNEAKPTFHIYANRSM